jgi:hypothetical protein
MSVLDPPIVVNFGVYTEIRQDDPDLQHEEHPVLSITPQQFTFQDSYLQPMIDSLQFERVMEPPFGKQ